MQSAKVQKCKNDDDTSPADGSGRWMGNHSSLAVVVGEGVAVDGVVADHVVVGVVRLAEIGKLQVSAPPSPP